MLVHKAKMLGRISKVGQGSFPEETGISQGNRKLKFCRNPGCSSVVPVDLLVIEPLIPMYTCPSHFLSYPGSIYYPVM